MGILFLVGYFTRVPDSFELVYCEHMAQILALVFDCSVKNLCYRSKTLLVVGGTGTSVLADAR